MGAWLFAYTISMIGVNPYDQSLVLFFAIVGVIGSLGEVVPRTAGDAEPEGLEFAKE